MRGIVAIVFVDDKFEGVRHPAESLELGDFFRGFRHESERQAYPPAHLIDDHRLARPHPFNLCFHARKILCSPGVSSSYIRGVWNNLLATFVHCYALVRMSRYDP